VDVGADASVDISVNETAAIAEPAATVNAIVADELRPLARRIDVEGYYPADILRRLGAAGAFAHHSERHGAGPAGIVAAVDAMAEVGEACLSTAASGSILGGTGLSSPMKFFSGIEPLALKGVRVPGGYRVTGRLPYVSNIEIGHLFGSIFALEGTPDRRIMALFRVGHDGVSMARNAHFIALEGTATYTVLIRDAFVSDDDVLSEEANRFVPRIRKGFVLLQTGMGFGIARGAVRLMRTDGPGRRNAIHLPLGPDLIDERADALARRVTDHGVTSRRPIARRFSKCCAPDWIFPGWRWKPRNPRCSSSAPADISRAPSRRVICVKRSSSPSSRRRSSISSPSWRKDEGG